MSRHHTERVFPASLQARNVIEQWAVKHHFKLILEDSTRYFYQGTKQFASLFIELAEAEGKFRIRAYCKLNLWQRALGLFLVTDRRGLDSNGFLAHMQRERAARKVDSLFRALRLPAIRERRILKLWSLYPFSLGLVVMAYALHRALLDGMPTEFGAASPVHFRPELLTAVTDGILAFLFLLFSIIYWHTMRRTANRVIRAFAYCLLSGAYFLLGLGLAPAGIQHAVSLNKVTFHCFSAPSPVACEESKARYADIIRKAPAPEAVILAISVLRKQYPKSPSIRAWEGLNQPAPLRGLASRQ